MRMVLGNEKPGEEHPSPGFRYGPDRLATASSEGTTATSSRHIDFKGFTVHGHVGHVRTVEDNHDSAGFRDIAVGSVADIDRHITRDRARKRPRVLRARDRVDDVHHERGARHTVAPCAVFVRVLAPGHAGVTRAVHGSGFLFSLEPGDPVVT